MVFARLNIQIEDGFTYDIEHEADEPVMSRKGQQNFVYQKDMLKVVNDALPIEEIHRCRQEVPVQRFRELDIPRPARNACNCNHLLKRHDLDGGDNGNYVYVAGEHGEEEDGYHDKGPYCPGNERLLFLLVI